MVSLKPSVTWRNATLGHLLKDSERSEQEIRFESIQQTGSGTGEADLF